MSCCTIRPHCLTIPTPQIKAAVLITSALASIALLGGIQGHLSMQGVLLGGVVSKEAASVLLVGGGVLAIFTALWIAKLRSPFKQTLAHRLWRDIPLHAHYREYETRNFTEEGIVHYGLAVGDRMAYNSLYLFRNRGARERFIRKNCAGYDDVTNKPARPLLQRIASIRTSDGN